VKHDSDEKSIVRCIICGETLDGQESVRYVGAVAHASCASRTIEENVEGFDRRPFYIGSMGFLIALSSYIPLYLLGINSGLYALAFVGIAIGLVLQSVGFLGIQRNYHMPRANVPYFLALITAALYSGARGISNNVDSNDGNFSICCFSHDWFSHGDGCCGDIYA